MLFQNVTFEQQPAYINLNDTTALTDYASAINESKGIQRSKGSIGGYNTDYSDLATNVSGRPGLTKSDYYKFRPQEKPPQCFRDIFLAVDLVYQKVGLIRNIIDLMGDFACQGIRLVHPNRKIEKFYQKWFERVNGKSQSERFLNHLYRLGNVIIRRQTAHLTKPAEKKVMRAFGGADVDIQQLKVTKREIPWRYVFIHPSVVEVVGGPLASFVGNPVYMMNIPTKLRRMINNPKGAEQKELVSKLPSEVVQAAKRKNGFILPPNKTSVFHYKKDDWQSWAYPMIYAILDDIAILEKLRLADMAALDGAISNLRIIKLGSLEHQLAPTSVAISKISEILESNVGGGTMDFVWGPDIELIESKTSVHQFLGEEKYRPHLNAIYAGLGIPPTLTGTFGAAGTTNNFISLKTLIYRLEYGRDILVQFWNKEIEIVQKAMGFRLPAKVEFRFTNLGDEEAEKALWIQLADRNLMSDELLQYKFGSDVSMEKVRINRENRERNNGQMVNKAGPYHDPQFGVALKKIALNRRTLTPSQVGLNQDAKNYTLRTFPNKDEVNNPINDSTDDQINLDNKQRQPDGRPKNSRDITRDDRSFKPKVRALEIWAKDAQYAIASHLNDYILKVYNKKNLRSLGSKEVNNAELLKFCVLCHLEPFTYIDKNKVLAALKRGGISNEIYKIYRYWHNSIAHILNRKLTLDEQKQIQAYIYALYYK